MDLVTSLLTQAQPVSTELERRGHLVVLVGGAVRDALLGRPWREIDLATSASAAELGQWLSAVGRVRDLGYGVVQVKSPDATYHLARLRQEGEYLDARHPQRVDFAATIDQDLSRRDYTVNAIALTPGGTWIDPFFGRSDLDRRTLRALPEAVSRLAEDPLRILRGIRLISERDLTADGQTETALWQPQALQRTPPTRADQELWRLVQGEAAGQTWNHYQSLLSALWPWAGPADLTPWVAQAPLAILALATGAGQPQAGLTWLRGRLSDRRWQRLGKLVGLLGRAVEGGAAAERTVAAALSTTELNWLAIMDAEHYRPAWERVQREGIARRLALGPEAIAAACGRPAGPWLRDCQQWLWRRVRANPDENTQKRLGRAVLEWLAISNRAKEGP
ncbi:MAG: tRNA nucleotidyltransferase/poly(A) polymerase family protein [Sulfobacillus sp.]